VVILECGVAVLARAWPSFERRVNARVAVLGQRIKSVKPNAAKLWKQLRQQSNLPRKNLTEI